MSEFIHDDFLLKTGPARRLYHEYAAGLPIIDYHNHLEPRELEDPKGTGTFPAGKRASWVE